ncbi:MAG TPA: NfeD family protein [Nitriliruptorales bacterium]
MAVGTLRRMSRHRLPPLRSALLVLVMGALALGAAAGAWGRQDAPGTSIDILPIEGTLDPPVAAAIQDLLAGAQGRGTDLVVLQVDSRGGLALDEQRLLDAVASAPVPVVVYVGPGLAAAEAGGLAGLLVLAADVGAMAPDATFGPLVPVDLADDAPAADRLLLDEVLVGAHLHAGRDGVPGGLDQRLADETLSADEALAAGVITLQALSLDALLTDLDGMTISGASGVTELSLRAGEVTVKLHGLGLVRRSLHASATPIFIYLMLVIGLGLLLFELFQPGFGVAGIAALIVLVFAVYGVIVLPVAWWAVLLIAAGLGLLAADVAIAGLGIPTAAGAAALTAGSMFLYPSPHLGVPGWLIATMVACALVFFVVVLTIVLRAQAGPDTAGIDQLVGQEGVVRSALNPEGHVFVDGALWRARWTDELEAKVAVGTPVRVHGVDGAVILVATAGELDAAERVGAASSDEA